MAAGRGADPDAVAVVSAGLTEQDDLLAVGVVPVAVTDWFGDQPFGAWPWAQPALAGAHPVVLNLADGIAVDQIAALRPDLIVATNAGLEADLVIAAQRNVFTDKDLAGAIAFASPLSYPVVAERLPPLIAAA